MVEVLHIHVAYPTVMEKRANTDVTLPRTSGKQHCQHGPPAPIPSDSCSVIPHWPAGNDTLPPVPVEMRMVCGANDSWGKLDLHSVSEIVHYAVRNNIIHIAQPPAA